MVRAKGLDDLFFGGGRPRFRRWYPVPGSVRERRAVHDLAEPGHVNGGGTLQQARDATGSAIEAFVAEPLAMVGQALLVMAAPGAGKSTAVAAAVKRHHVEARVVVGTKALAGEMADGHGYNLIEGRNRTNCERYDVVHALGEAGHPVEALACGTPFEPRCPFRDVCPYFAQYARAGARVGTTEQLYNGQFLAGGTLVVVDDADLQRALLDRPFIRGDALERAEGQLANPRYAAAGAVLRVVQHALIEAPARWLLGGHAWDHLVATAARLGLDFEALVEALPDLEMLPEPYDDVEGYVTVRTVEAVPPASATMLLAALKEELEAFRSSEDFNSRVRITKGVVQVGRLREHIADREGAVIARLPLLVLDATPLPVLIDHLTALHERLPDVRAEIALPPNVTVVQYATGTNGYTSLRSDREVQRVLGEIDRERLAMPLAAEQEALIVYKQSVTSFGGAGFAADRILTYGSARGTNVLADVRRLHVVGRPHPPLEETFYVAQVIHHDEVAVAPEMVLRRREFGAQRFAIDVVDYADPRTAALLRAAREDEAVQVIHRARLLTLDRQAGMDRDARNRVVLVLHSSHPVPGLRVDRMIRSDDRGSGWNDGVHADAVRRIAEAIERLRAKGSPLTVNTVSSEARASKRTVRSYVRTKDHTPLDVTELEAAFISVRKEDHTPLDEMSHAGGRLANDTDDVRTKDHTPLNDSIRGVISIPQAPAELAEWDAGRAGRRLRPGDRHKVKGPFIGTVHPSDGAFLAWRPNSGWPHAGIMTVEGQVVLVADVEASLRTGIIEVIGVEPRERAS